MTQAKHVFGALWMVVCRTRHVPSCSGSPGRGASGRGRNGGALCFAHLGVAGSFGHHGVGQNIPRSSEDLAHVVYFNQRAPHWYLVWGHTGQTWQSRFVVSPVACNTHIPGPQPYARPSITGVRVPTQLNGRQCQTSSSATKGSCDCVGHEQGEQVGVQFDS